MSKPVKILIVVAVIVWALAGTVTTYIQYTNPRVKIKEVEKVKLVDRFHTDEDTEIVETFHSNGVVASRTTRKRIKTDRESNRDSEAGRDSLSEPVLPPAPRWNVMATIDPFTGQMRAGAGMNFGPLSVWVDNTMAVELFPKIGVMLRF